jgi:tetratricopeptide (TPR) repeat protein
MPKVDFRLTVIMLAVLLAVLAVGRGYRQNEQSLAAAPPETATGKNLFAGSNSCGDCHEKFNKLWSTYWHGMSMRPYGDELADKQFSLQNNYITIGERRYKAEIGHGQGWVLENGPDGQRKFPIQYVIGGKNVCYLLTPLERGRLQVLPVAYDVNNHNWFDTTASAVGHLSGLRANNIKTSQKTSGGNAALPWTDRHYTFNTACFNCHISRLAANYDPDTDSYHTSWGEPGISCETCHGPSAEHNRLMKSGIKGRSAEEMKIIVNKDLSHDQINDHCASCHAKIIPLSQDFSPGDKFFDHYDLITLEHEDYFPDGCDLGENYTFGTWLLAPCLKSGKLDCKYCHTPAGRYKFTEYQGYQTCMPCHEKYVTKPEVHGHHAAGSKGNECTACHMPKTWFAGRARTDHSMRAPAPAATITYNSPNACNVCHPDHDAAWSDQWVRKWYPRDYQAEVLRKAGLIDAARNNRWDRLDEMLAEIGRAENDQVYRNSLVRLLRQCNDPRKWEALDRAVEDKSPLVRSSAAAALGGRTDPRSIGALLSAAGDKSRLVRIRAAQALAPIRPEDIQDPAKRKSLQKAADEFQAAMSARADDWAAQANLGNFRLERGEFDLAVKHYENALRLEPRMSDLLINLSVAYGGLNDAGRAEQCLRRALETDPDNAAANFNLGLLLVEQGKSEEAEKSLRAALKAESAAGKNLLPAAAYNLSVILAGKNNFAEALAWSKKACDAQPNEPKYARALAFCLRLNGDFDGAIKVLKKALSGDNLAPGAIQELENDMRRLEQEKNQTKTP